MSLKEYAADGGTALDESADAADHFAHVPLKLIVLSRTNPRKTFDQVKLQELADSIQASGVHQPVLLRPLPADRLEETSTAPGARPTHELVAGERRYRASQLAGVATIPAMIRRLTDAEVVEIQIVENLQRADLSELEEAEGYELLMQHAGVKADQVGAKIGKSKSYVYARLKLLDLSQAGRKALREGQIDASKALLLARIPNERLQAEALKEIMRTDYYGDAMSAREAADHIQRTYMLKLSTARFVITDAALVPAAGSCKECPKRTGHAPDLFSDVKGADVCTDPTCFRAKEAAHSAGIVEAAKAKGQTVIAGKEAQELVAQNGYNAKLKGYKRLDVADDSPTGEPLRKIIGAQMKDEGISPVMIEHPTKKGDLVAALPNEVVLRLIKTVEGQAAAAKTVAKEVRQLVDEKKAKAEAKAKAQYEQAWRNALLARTWDRLEGGGVAAFTLDVHRHQAREAVQRLTLEEATAIAELLGLGKVGPFAALNDYVKITANPDLLQLLIIMQRDSKTDDCTYIGSERVPNVGLMLIARIVFGEELSDVTRDVQSQAMVQHFPEVKAGRPDLPLAPAAQASTSRVPKGKKAQGPAAPDGAKPVLKRKTTAQEAMEGIAEAMQGIEASAPADAGSSADVDVPGAADGDTVAGSAGALQGEEAVPVAGALSPSVDATAAALKPGQAVCVNARARSAIARPYFGRVGRLSNPAGPQAWFVEFLGIQASCSFHVSELDLVAADVVDPLLQRATDLVAREKKATVRMLKAEFGVGTQGAMDLMAALERAGTVSPCDERGARKVLVTA